jgi:hypothetical protein
MITNPVQSLPVTQNEAAVKTATRQNAPSPSVLPQDKVTISPQAQAQLQTQAQAQLQTQAQAQPQKAVSTDKDHDGDSK